MLESCTEACHGVPLDVLHTSPNTQRKWTVSGNSANRQSVSGQKDNLRALVNGPCGQFLVTLPTLSPFQARRTTCAHWLMADCARPLPTDCVCDRFTLDRFSSSTTTWCPRVGVHRHGDRGDREHPCGARGKERKRVRNTGTVNPHTGNTH